MGVGLLSFWSQPTLAHCPVTSTPGYTWPFGSPRSSFHLPPCLYPHETLAPTPHPHPAARPPAQRHLLIRPEEEADLDPGSMPLCPKPWLEGTNKTLMDVSALHTSDHFPSVSLTTSCLPPQAPAHNHNFLG